MGLKLPKSNLSKSKLIGRWQQFYDSLDRQDPLESLTFDVMRPLQLDFESPALDDLLFSDDNDALTSDSESDDDSEGALESQAGTTNNTFGQLGTPYSALVDSIFNGASTNPLPQAPGMSMSQFYNQSIQPLLGQHIPMQNTLPQTVNPPSKSKKSSAVKSSKSVKKTPSKSTSRKSVRWAVSPSASQPKQPPKTASRRNLGLQFPPPPTQQQNLEHLMKLMQMSNPAAPQPVQQPMNPFGMLQMQQMQQMQQQIQQQQQMQSQLMAAILNPNLNSTSADLVSPLDLPPTDARLQNTSSLPLRSSRRSGTMPANPGTNNLKITGASIPPLRSADVASDSGLRRPIKSGRYRSSCQEVRHEQPWPNCMLDTTMFPIAPEYEDMSWGQFMAGATSCILYHIDNGATVTETENQV